MRIFFLVLFFIIESRSWYLEIKLAAFHVTNFNNEKRAEYREQLVQIFRHFDFIFVSDIRGEDENTKNVIVEFLEDLNKQFQWDWDWRNKFSVVYSDGRGPIYSSTNYRQRFAFFYLPNKIQIINKEDDYPGFFTPEKYSFPPYPLYINIRYADYRLALFNFLGRHDDKGKEVYPYHRPLEYSYASYEFHQFLKEYDDNFRNGNADTLTETEKWVFKHRPIIWGDLRFDCAYGSHILQRPIEKEVWEKSMIWLVRNNSLTRRYSCSYDRILTTELVAWWEHSIEYGIFNFTEEVPRTKLKEAYLISENYPVYIKLAFYIIGGFEIAAFIAIGCVIVIISCCCCMIVFGAVGVMIFWSTRKKSGQKGGFALFFICLREIRRVDLFNELMNKLPFRIREPSEVELQKSAAIQKRFGFLSFLGKKKQQQPPPENLVPGEIMSANDEDQDGSDDQT